MKKFFDSCAENWDKRLHIDPDKLHDILKVAGNSTKGRVLDVACGTGVMIPFLLEKDPSYLTAIDLSPAMVRIAKAKYNHPKLSILEKDLFTFKLEDVDLVVVYNAYPHFTDKARFAEAVHGILRPAGRLLIAHGMGRALINARHEGGEASSLSKPLRSAREEAQELSTCFAIDHITDTDNLFILSGTSK